MFYICITLQDLRDFYMNYSDILNKDTHVLEYKISSVHKGGIMTQH